MENTVYNSFVDSVLNKLLKLKTIKIIKLLKHSSLKKQHSSFKDTVLNFENIQLVIPRFRGGKKPYHFTKLDYYKIFLFQLIALKQYF